MCFHEFRNTNTDRVETMYVLTTALIVIVSVLILNGCSTASQARQRLDDGDPFTAVELFDRAIERNPNDTALIVESREAHSQAGDIVAAQARKALASGDFPAALNFARQAIEYDRMHTDLEAQVRNAWSADLLAKGQRELAASNFDGARRLATQAGDITPASGAVATFKSSIASAEAGHLEASARALAQAGDFDRAMTAANRAAQLTPSDDEAAHLPDAISQQQREAEFDRLAIKALAHLRDGKLTALDRVLETMATLNVRMETMQNLTAQRDAAHAQLQTELTSAAEARLHGDFAAALRHYAAAKAIGSDVERVRSEREACESEQLAAELRTQGEEAFARGDYQRAAADLEQSFELNADQSTQQLVNKARAAMFRQQLDAAMTKGDLPAAIAALNSIQRFEPMADYPEQLDAMTNDLITSASNQASELHAKRKTGQAILVLERALAVTSNEQLATMHGWLVSENLIQLAVAAEQAGDFTSARGYYLDALAAGGDRAGISQRVDNTAALADLEYRLGSAEREIDDLHREIDVRDSVARQLQLQLHDAEYALHALHAEADHLRSDLDCAVRDNRSLQHTIDDLRRQVRDAQEQARRAERAARQSANTRPSGQNGRRP